MRGQKTKRLLKNEKYFLAINKQLFDIANVGHDAVLVESLKYDRLVFEEIQADPFLIMALAA